MCSSYRGLWLHHAHHPQTQSPNPTPTQPKTGVGKRPLIVAMTRKDMAPPEAMKEWSDHYIKAARAASRQGQPRVPVVFVDARQGVDIHRLKMIALKAGAAVNQRCVPCVPCLCRVGAWGLGGRAGGLVLFFD